MSEAEFEGLLEGVLQETALAEPLAGLEDRVMVRIADASAARGARWRLGQLAGGLGAAGMVWVVVLAVLSSPLHQDGREVAPPSARATTLPRSGARLGVELSQLGPVAQTTGERRAGLHGARRVRSRERMSVGRINVAPLSVEPIEVAALTMEERWIKGESR